MASATQLFDAVVIGAGFSGMHMLKSLRDKLGLKVRVYEAGETVGGTWFWNRYPGARCDSDAYIYCFTWDKQLLQEWDWTERYPEQPEILRYLEHVAKRHDLKRDMQFIRALPAPNSTRRPICGGCAPTRAKRSRHII
jgi:cation diffusion facilitator CzcD-associated flavoprotein CzcO